MLTRTSRKDLPPCCYASLFHVCKTYGNNPLNWPLSFRCLHCNKLYRKYRLPKEADAVIGWVLIPRHSHPTPDPSAFYDYNEPYEFGTVNSDRVKKY
jgi:hypothetical protein